jgi:hypothetical protein
MFTNILCMDSIFKTDTEDSINTGFKTTRTKLVELKPIL